MIKNSPKATTLAHSANGTAPTQGLRDLIDLMEGGLTSVEDLHNELLRVETLLGLPMTTVSEWNGLDEDDIAQIKADRLADATNGAL